MNALDVEVVKSREKSVDLRRGTMLIVKELQDNFIDVKKAVLSRLPESDTPSGRARVGRVLSGITADSKIFALLEQIKLESISK